MSNEASKAAYRRMHHPAFIRYFAGRGIDVGCGSDSIGKQRHLWPLMESVTDWDTPQGDAQALSGVPSDTYDFLHSSHCLEHLISPASALVRWCEVVKPGGFLIIMVPDADLYEQGVWPSSYNSDHKHRFTLGSNRESVNVIDLIQAVRPVAYPLSIELLHSTFDQSGPRRDQTLGLGESAIEFVLRRRFNS